MKRVTVYKTSRGVRDWAAATERGARAALFHGSCKTLLPDLAPNSIDLIITSPPYCMGKEYEKRGDDLKTFVQSHEVMLPLAIAALKPGGSLCWQVGHHVESAISTPLDYLIFQLLSKYPEMKLRNRIIWTFGHGLHCETRFSGRYETVLWYTKGEDYTFELDAVRIAQKYPGKRHSKGPNQGALSGNPSGKNPSDVWEIPNVKSNHVEKTIHPCQFPVGLAQRLVRALSNEGDLVLDPFCGVASTGVAALLEKRNFLGAETKKKYVNISMARLALAARNELPYRPADRAIHVPSPTSKVATRPENFAVPAQAMTEL